MVTETERDDALRLLLIEQVTRDQRGRTSKLGSTATEPKRGQRLRPRSQILASAVVLVTAVVVTVTIPNIVQHPSKGPLNMVSGGVSVIGPGLNVERGAPLPVSDTPSPTTRASGQVLIELYEDFGSPLCKDFESQNGPFLRSLVRSGSAELQYHPVAVLDRNYTRNYSTRAANASAAVATYSPSTFLKFHDLLYFGSEQPIEGSPGLTDSQLLDLAKRAKSRNLAHIKLAIENEEFSPWVKARSDEFVAGSGSLANVRLPSTWSPGFTPTLVVNGRVWNGSGSLHSFITDVENGRR